jgi:hypothetical protein
MQKVTPAACPTFSMCSRFDVTTASPRRAAPYYRHINDVVVA